MSDVYKKSFLERTISKLADIITITFGNISLSIEKIPINGLEKQRKFRVKKFLEPDFGVFFVFERLPFQIMSHTTEYVVFWQSEIGAAWWLNKYFPYPAP